MDDEPIKIILKAEDLDFSMSKARYLLEQGGSVNEMSVLRCLAELLGGPETEREDVVFLRADSDNMVREFSARTICCAVQEGVNPFPEIDRLPLTTKSDATTTE